MSDSESRSNGGLDAAWKASAVEATVPPTAGEMLAEWLQEIECERGAMLSRPRWDNYETKRYFLLSDRSVRIRSYLDANHAST